MKRDSLPHEPSARVPVVVVRVDDANAAHLSQTLASLAWQRHRPSRVIVQCAPSVRTSAVRAAQEHAARLDVRVADAQVDDGLVLQSGAVAHPAWLEHVHAAALRGDAEWRWPVRVIDDDGLLVRPSSTTSLWTSLRALPGPARGQAHGKPLVAVRLTGNGAKRAVAGAFAETRDARSLPTIGVLIPARNVAAYLRDTLESVADQTRVPDEVVVVDDGSTDDTAALARAHSVVTRVIPGPSRGLAAARNAGLRALGTDLAVLLDGDDLLEPDWIARAVGMAARFPHAGVVVGRGLSVDEDGTRLFGRHQPPSGWSPRAFATRNALGCVSGVVLRRDVVLAAGGFDERVAFAEDYELWQRLCTQTTLVAADAPMTRVRMRRGSMMRDGKFDDMLAWQLRRVGDDAGSAALAHLDVARRAVAYGDTAFGARAARRALTLASTPAIARTALSLLAACALPTPALGVLLDGRRQVRRTLGAVLDRWLPAPLGRAVDDE